MKKFGFFNSIGGDRKYLASDISQAFDIGITTGLKAEEGNLQVVPHEGMQMQIQPGSAMIFGHFFMNDEPEIITLDVADAELNRIDRIVVRYDAYTREVNTAIIKGSPAISPVAPAILRTDEQYDLVLADIYVPAAATVINESNITDMRESELCGYIGVKGAVPQLDFDAHLAESMTQLVGTSVILANISSGSKTYIGPFQKPPKRISIMARINDTPSANWGEIIESNAQYRMSQHSSGVMTGGSTNLISLSNTTGGSVLAVGSIEPDGRLELTWQKTGTITEAAIIYTTAMFHGGE